MTSWWKLTLLGAVLVLPGCKGETQDTSEIRPVRTIAVDPQPVEDDRSAVGEVKPRYESDLGFRVAGKVISRAVDVGVSVKKDDTLARLDEQDFRNKLRSAQADVTAADAVLTDAKGTENRMRQLLSTGTTTQAIYDTALKNLRSAAAKLDAAKAAASLAQDQLNYAELRAEFDGVITATGAEAGQVVNAGQMIVRLAQPNDKDAVFSIAESAFRVARKDNETIGIVVALLSNPDIKADAVVREISPVADPVTRTYQIKVTLDNPPPEMRFGASVLGRLKASTAPVVVLPASALFDQGGKPAVWVFNPADQTVALRNIVVSRYETDRVIVSDGLAKGDIVVTAGVNRLREKQKVRLAEGEQK